MTLYKVIININYIYSCFIIFFFSLDELYNFMKHHHCLLLTLFDRPLILNTKDSITKDSNNEYYTISFKNDDENNGLLSLFHDSEQNNYGIVVVNGHVRKIQFDELKLDSLMKLKTNNHEYKHLRFSELTDHK